MYTLVCKSLSAASATIDLPLTIRTVSGRWMVSAWEGIPNILLWPHFLGLLKSFMHSKPKIKLWLWARRIARGDLSASVAYASFWSSTSWRSTCYRSPPFDVCWWWNITDVTLIKYKRQSVPFISLFFATTQKMLTLDKSVTAYFFFVSVAQLLPNQPQLLLV